MIVSHSEPLIRMPPLEKLSVTLTFESATFKMSSVSRGPGNEQSFHYSTSMHSGDMRGNVSESCYVAIFGLAVTLTFDLLISKSKQLIFAPHCTKVVNLVKFPRAVYKILCSQTFSVRLHTHIALTASEGIEIANEYNRCVPSVQRSS